MKQLPAIHLRALEPEDLELLYQIENDRELWRVGATNVPYSRYVLRDYIANTCSDIYADRQLRMMIEDDSRQTVGIVDLVNFDPRHMRAEVGLVIAAPYRRRHYATATVRELCRYADDVLHLHQLYIVADRDNNPAIQLFLNEHFLLTSTLREWLFTGSEYRDAVVLQTFFEKK